MFRMTKISTISLLWFSLLFSIPLVMNYQGKVTDTSGVALDGTYDITFRIFDDATGGTELWSEAHSGVLVRKGLFDIVLGTTNPINLPFDTQYWLELVVEGEVMSPRIQMTSVGYSYRAAIADSAIGGGAVQDTFIAQWDSIRNVPAGFADGTDDVNDADPDPNNELITAASYETAGEDILRITEAGTNWDITIDNEADNLSDNVIADLSDVSSTAPSSGEVLKWNGSTWAPAEDDTGSGGTSISISQGNGIFCSPNPITGTGTVSVDNSWFSGDATVNSSGVIDLANGAVEWAELTTAVQDSIQASRGQWTDAGSYIQANNNTNARVYDDGESYGFYYNGGNSTGGYFNSSTGYGVEVRGVLRGAYGVGDIGIYGEATSGGTAGVYALGTDANEAVYAQGGNRGLYAVADTAVYGSSGETDGFGGYFISSADTNGTGVYGFATSKYGTGVWGISPGDSIGWGVYGSGGGNDGAVFGEIAGYSGSWYTATAVTGLSPNIGGFFAGDTTDYSWGCFAQTNDENGIALRAQSLSNTTSGYNYSVFATCSTGTEKDVSDSIIALGVPLYGMNYADSGIAVIGVGNNLDVTNILSRGAGVIGNSREVGVFGFGDTTGGSFGVLGRSEATDGIGVHGADNDLVLPGGITNGAGVVGYSDNVGVFGWGDTTTQSYGVYGTSDDATGGYGVVGIANIGVQGEGNSTAAANIGIVGYAANYASGTDVGIYGQCEDVISDWAGYFVGDVYINGDIFCSGPKSAAIQDKDGWHAVYCQESPEIWFEDFGSGQLENGKAYIQLHKDFLGIVTINKDYPMKVFIQLTDPECNGVAVVKHQDGFEVIELAEGKSDATFDWRVVAKRKGFENRRFDLVSKQSNKIRPNSLRKVNINQKNQPKTISVSNSEHKYLDEKKLNGKSNLIKK